MRREPENSGVPGWARPSAERAAAAARLFGAPSGEEAVAARMRHAARRSGSAVAAPRPARPEGTGPTGPTALGVTGSTALAAAPDASPAREERARPRHLRVVPDGLTAAQRRRRARAVLMGAIGASAAIGLALVYFHVILAQRQFAIDHLQSQVQQAQSSYQQQRLDVAELGSPAHIVATAEGQLGMVQPANVTYLTPAGGRIVSDGTNSETPLGQGSGPTVRTPAQAPAGDADWPEIKSQLAGTP